MQMKNTFTLGSEYGHIPGPPVNEDYTILVEVQSSENGIVTGKKLWDASQNPKLFYAKLLWYGRNGDPPDGILKAGQIALFHRCGDFNSQGTEGPERHVEAAEKYSWVCFAHAQLIFVEDLGESLGREVAFDETGQKQVPAGSETLNLKFIDTTYYGSPSKAGRIYLAQRIEGTPSYYLCFVPGYGDEADSFSVTVGSDTLEIKVDGAGNVLDFTVS